MKQELDCVMDIGEQMLLCGAETHRVEDSVTRMCLALGAERIDVFFITTSMIATYYKDGAGYTQTRRVPSGAITTDIERLHRLNALSRRICAEHPSVDEIRFEYGKILAQRPYPFWAELLACAAITGSFTVFFGGTLAEGGVSLLIGAFVKLLLWFTEKTLKNKIFAKFICSFVATAFAFLALQAGLVPRVDKIIIGNIMTLIPGVGLTNAMRDLFTGDSIAGLLRCIEALLLAVAIGGGYFLFVTMVGGL